MVMDLGMMLNLGMTMPENGYLLVSILVHLLLFFGSLLTLFGSLSASSGQCHVFLCSVSFFMLPYP
jgi:hypothetical protein